MYAVAPDPYCYVRTTVLKNFAGLRTTEQLERFETAMVSLRGEEPLPEGRLDVAHFRAVHRHLFQDVYRWAGKTRRVRISRDGSTFCYPENIEASLDDLFARLKERQFLTNLTKAKFAVGAAAFLAELNAIHAFRDGNGRAQLAFLALLSLNAGHPIDFSRLDEAAFLDAMIASFRGREAPLARQVGAMIT